MNNRQASCGGILRDSYGSFILAYAGLVGRCSVAHAELWAIYHGLRLIKDRFISSPIIIESDSSTAVSFLNEGCPRSNPCYSLLNHIVRMSDGFNKIDCTHVLEANQVADGFAKLGFSLPEGVHSFSSPPQVGHIFFYLLTSLQFFSLVDISFCILDF
uniref:Ribonuclease H protein At1g65750 family n=1 Tax=Cajanus cajan TaxID=3821 RepID=A0A151R8F4_CAJCA|nr:Putative ribonuclease H protein At1g65750 family [Cajanus cajan]